MKTLLKRLGAYFIDYVIVTLVIYGLMLLPFVNPHKEEYNTKYNEVIRVNEQFQNNEMSEEEFEEALVPLAYDLYRLYGSYVIVSTLCFIGYFVVFQFLNKGKTVGKRLFKLKVCSKDDKEVTFGAFLIRAIVLYNLLIPILELIVVYVMKVDTYYGVYQNVNMVGYIIMYISLFLMLVRTDGRGLHDLVARTIVVEESASKEKEAPVIEVKETEKSVKKTTKAPKKSSSSTKKTKSNEK